MPPPTPTAPAPQAGQNTGTQPPTPGGSARNAATGQGPLLNPQTNKPLTPHQAGQRASSKVAANGGTQGSQAAAYNFGSNAQKAALQAAVAAGGSNAAAAAAALGTPAGTTKSGPGILSQTAGAVGAGYNAAKQSLGGEGGQGGEKGGQKTEFDLILHTPDGGRESMKIGGNETPSREVILENLGGKEELTREVPGESDPEWRKPFQERSPEHREKLYELLQKAGWKPAEPESEEPEESKEEE